MQRRLPRVAECCCRCKGWDGSALTSVRLVACGRDTVVNICGGRGMILDLDRIYESERLLSRLHAASEAERRFRWVSTSSLACEWIKLVSSNVERSRAPAWRGDWRPRAPFWTSVQLAAVLFSTHMYCRISVLVRAGLQEPPGSYST